jgi:hypothetical protein
MDPGKNTGIVIKNGGLIYYCESWEYFINLLYKKSEVGSWKSEVGSRKPEVGSRKPEAGSRKPEVGSRKPEVGSRKSEAVSRKPEVGSRMPEFRRLSLTQDSGLRTFGLEKNILQINKIINYEQTSYAFYGSMG